MRSLPELEDDQRIRRLLTDFDKRYTGQDFNSATQKTNGSSVTPDQLDGVRSIFINHQLTQNSLNLFLSCSCRNNLSHFVCATCTRLCVQRII